MCDTCKEFCDEYKIGKGDLILSNEYIFEPYFSQYVSGATVVYVEKYGTGEPSDEMVEAIYADIKLPPRVCYRGRYDHRCVKIICIGKSIAGA